MTEDRLMHLDRMRELGYAPYLTDHMFDGDFSYQEGTYANIAGRILTIRRMGKICFCTLLYSNKWGELGKMQIVFREGESHESWLEFTRALDIGDIVCGVGQCRATTAGEPSVWLSGFNILSKAVEHVPFGTSKDGEDFNKIADVETLLRHRHLALLTDAELRQRLIMRSRVISAIRDWMFESGYIEAQTPILLSVPGGEARPFVTDYHAYDAQVKLRMSLEVSLKKLLCGGFDRVYEIGTVFRNEGISPRHNPEFTELEYYTAYCDFGSGLSRFKHLIYSVCYETGFEPIRWRSMTVRDAILAVTGDDIESYDFNDPSFAGTLEGMIGAVEESFAENDHVLLTHHPVCLTPLARTRDGKYAERFEAYYGGVEIANGFCEQCDPILQRQVLEAQGGDLDESFIHALGCGMPPAFGVGIGIDRLVMMFSGASHIRDVTWFPYTRQAVEN